MASVAVGKVGDLKLVLGSVVPAGFLSLGEGTSLNRTEYSELWTWAQNNARVISETNWNSEVNTNGSCGAFSTGNGSTTFRLPKVQALLKAAAKSAASTFNKAVYNSTHYHGMGPMVNNNGNWGRLSYTGAKYPSGAKGWYWNGKGGHSTYENPPYDGNIITSLNIGDDSSNVPVPASINLMLCIRYTTEYQETAVGVSVAAAYMAVNNMADVLNASTAAYLVASMLGTTGWQLYDTGELEQWGVTVPGANKGEIRFPICMSSNPHSIKLTLVDPNNKCVDARPRIVDVKDAYATYTVDGTYDADAYLMWYAHGKN